MPTPSPSWNSVRVHGTWVNQDGSLKAGSYKVSIPVRVTNDTDDVIIPSGTFATGTLNTTNGLPSFDLQIPATDDPDNSPPFQVRIEITFPDALGEMYQIDVPVALKDDANGLDLEKVVLTSTFTPVETLVKGIPGGVAELDSEGFVLDASGTRVTGGAAVDLSGYATTNSVTTGLATKVNSSTYTAGLAAKADASALTSEAATARAAEGALRNLSDNAFSTALSATIAGQAEPVGHAAPVIRNVADWKMWQQDMAAWTVSGAASSNVADTSHPLFGTKALTMTTDGAGGFANASVTGLTAVDFARKQLQVVVEVDAPTLLSSLKAVLGTGGFVNGYNLTLQLTSSAGTAGLQVIQAGVPTVLSVSFQDSSAVGTPTISNINALRIQAKDTATGTGVKVTVHAVMYSDVATLAYPNGAVVSWGFDDGYASQEVMVRYLAKLGQRVTLFPIKSLIDSGPAWLTTALLREFQDRLGAEVCGHAYTQAHHDNRLTSLSTPDLEADFAADRAWLKSRGFHGFDVTAYPGGIYSDAVKSTARRYWGAARGVVSNTKETFPAGDPYLIRGYPFDASVGGPTKAQIKTAVDNCVAFGGHLNLVVHDGVSGTATAGTVQVALADFYEVADYVAASGVAVRTLSEVLREQRTSVAPALGALSDVSVSSPASGDVPTWNATTKKWTNAQPAAGGSSVSALASEGFCFTVDPRYQKSSSVVFPGANRTYFMRAQGSKTGATKFRIFVGVASGNISLAVYSNTGTGPASLPTGTPKIATGAIACPTAGDAVITPGGSWNVAEGDWIALSCDNATASFAAGVNTGSANQYAGLSGLASVHPAPSPISTSPVATNQSFYIACE